MRGRGAASVAYLPLPNESIHVPSQHRIRRLGMAGRAAGRYDDIREVGAVDGPEPWTWLLCEVSSDILACGTAEQREEGVGGMQSYSLQYATSPAPDRHPNAAARLLIAGASRRRGANEICIAGQGAGWRLGRDMVGPRCATPISALVSSLGAFLAS